MHILTEKKEKEKQDKYKTMFLFCENNHFVSEYRNYYHCLPLQSFQQLGKDCSKGKIIYNDFVCIQTELIDTKLKDLLLKYSNSQSDTNGQNAHIHDVDCLYSKVKKRRNMCALLPFKTSIAQWYDISYNEYIKMIEKFNINKNQNLTKFCIIYNGIANMFLNYKNKGFDLYVHSIANGNSNTLSGLSDMVESYIVQEISKIGLFDSIQILNFEQLCKYCVQDIKLNKNAMSYGECINAYTINTSEKSDWDYGFVFFIINRLSFVIFHDLMCHENPNEKSDVMFPHLLPFYEFFYNFCVFVHCYPHCNVQTRKDEIFYMKEYHQLKNQLYDNNKYGLKNFSYFNNSAFGDDGTLLHRATYCGFQFYVELLLRDGFDCNFKNSSEYHKSSLKIANEQNHFDIVSLMNDHELSNNINNINSDNNDSDSSCMDDKSLELSYNSFTNQVMFAKYFLTLLGFTNINTINDKQIKKRIKHKKYYSNHYSDDLYYSWNEMIGLNINSNTVNSSKDENTNREQIIYGVVQTVIQILKKKLVLSDDLLIMCCVFANYWCNNNDNSNNSKLNELCVEFLMSLNETISECLLPQVVTTNCNDDNKNDDAKNKNNTDENNDNPNGLCFKERNYFWFKTCLINSNLWFIKLDDFNSKHSNSNESEKKEDILLFDKGLQVVNQGLVKQKQFIWNHLNFLRKTEKKQFEQLCQFGTVTENKTNTHDPQNMTSDIHIRQDRIENGIVSQLSELDTFVTRSLMGDEHKKFDIVFENNTKIYLTQCLTFAHANNIRFQNIMKEYFTKQLNVSCKYQSAPVKLYDRCVVKGTSDYSNHAFPSCANILDFMRFSVTFNSIKDLLTGLNNFVSDVNNGNISCLKRNGICRIKNGYGDINNWNNFNDAQYCDLKLNIIYTNKDNSQHMLIEAQFLLSFLIQAKKMGHKLYSFVRKQDFVENISNQCYTIDNNYKKYKFKINKLIDNNDTNNLIKHLFWKPNIVLSIINVNAGRRKYRPLLYDVSRKIKNTKFLMFFLNCLFHLSYVLLNEKNGNNTNVFLKKYFNWNSLKHDLIFEDEFYGCNQKMHANGFDTNGFVDLIMQQSYFNGLSQNDKYHISRISSCVLNKNFNYLTLISKYFDKNKEWVKNTLFDEYGNNPLHKVFQNQNALGSELTLNIVKEYLNLCQKSDVVIEAEDLNKLLVVISDHTWGKFVNADMTRLEIKKVLKSYRHVHYSQ